MSLQAQRFQLSAKKKSERANQKSDRHKKGRTASESNLIPIFLSGTPGTLIKAGRMCCFNNMRYRLVKTVKVPPGGMVRGQHKFLGYTF